MKSKFNKFMAFVALALLLVGISDYFIDSKIDEYDSYLVNYIHASDLLEKGMVFRCMNIGDKTTIKTSEEGLLGQCGITDFHYDVEKGCYGFYTFGEEINGTLLAEKQVELIKNKPKDTVNVIGLNLSIDFLKTLRWIFWLAALIFTGLAIFKGFKWR